MILHCRFHYLLQSYNQWQIKEATDFVILYCSSHYLLQSVNQWQKNLELINPFKAISFRFKKLDHLSQMVIQFIASSGIGAGMN
jgi:hypothetical protein